MYGDADCTQSGINGRTLFIDTSKGKADKAVALRFVSNKGLWRYEIHDIEGRVDPTLGKRLKADGDGWIVPPAAAPWDFGLIVLRNPLLALRRCRYLREIKPRLPPH